MKMMLSVLVWISIDLQHFLLLWLLDSDHVSFLVLFQNHLPYMICYKDAFECFTGNIIIMRLIPGDCRNKTRQNRWMETLMLIPWDHQCE